MFSWIGFTQTGVPFSSPPRASGRSMYTARKMFRLATDAIVGFSDRPLRLALNLGFVVSALSIAFGLSAVIVKLAGGFSVPGWASLMVLFGVVGGIQLIVLGVIGEYVGRIYDEVKQRPLYLMRETHGLGEEQRR
jgi:dolichol-phosphate mannosyltransferase